MITWIRPQDTSRVFKSLPRRDHQGPLFGCKQRRPAPLQLEASGHSPFTCQHQLSINWISISPLWDFEFDTHSFIARSCLFFPFSSASAFYTLYTMDMEDSLMEDSIFDDHSDSDAFSPVAAVVSCPFHLPYCNPPPYSPRLGPSWHFFRRRQRQRQDPKRLPLRKLRRSLRFPKQRRLRLLRRKWFRLL